MSHHEADERYNENYPNVCSLIQLFCMCLLKQILSLRESISNLVLSLVEENGPRKTQVALVITPLLKLEVL